MKADFHILLGDYLQTCDLGGFTTSFTEKHTAMHAALPERSFASRPLLPAGQAVEDQAQARRCEHIVIQRSVWVNVRERNMHRLN